MTKEFCITFAGPVGCSKSPIAHQLSLAFGWPIFSHDALRHEVIEDTLDPHLELDLLERRITERSKQIVERSGSFIYDASQDRHWDRFITNFEKTPPYIIGVISFDLSRDFYKRLLEAKQYNATLSRAKQLLESHTTFAQQHSDIIICSITDENFHDRLTIAEGTVRKFISDKTAAIQ